MEHEIELAVGFLGQVEHTRNVIIVLYVARCDQLGADRVGELAHPALHLITRQMREADLGALGQDLLSDGPGDAEIVRNPQHQALLALEESHS